MKRRRFAALLALVLCLGWLPGRAEGAPLSPEIGDFTCFYDQLDRRARLYYQLLDGISVEELVSAETDGQGRRVIRLSLTGEAEAILNGRVERGVFVKDENGADTRAFYADFEAAWLFLRMDKPEKLLFLRNRYTSYSVERVEGDRWRITELRLSFDLQYGGQEAAMYGEMMAGARAVAAEAAEEPDTWSRVKRAYDILLANNTYGYNASGEEISLQEDFLSHNAYSALVFGDGHDPVCTGYAPALDIVCGLMGIPCITVFTAGHAWNNVQMDDGLWYSIDPTWGDTRWDSSGTANYDYFLVGDETAVDGVRFKDQPAHRQISQWADTEVLPGVPLQALRFPMKSTEAYVYLGMDRGTAARNTAAVEIDGVMVELTFYALPDRINGGLTNYVRLRDLAMVLKETEGSFAVEYCDADRSISLVAGAAYVPEGTELRDSFALRERCYPADSELLVNGEAAELEAFYLLHPTEGASNYFKLRDLGRALGFNVSWVEDHIVVNTGEPYSDEQ